MTKRLSRIVGYALFAIGVVLACPGWWLLEFGEELIWIGRRQE